MWAFALTHRDCYLGEQYQLHSDIESGHQRAAIEIFEKFKTKEIKGRGSFISYEAGGSGIAYLNYLNKSPKLSAHVVEFADKMFKNQKLTSEGLLTAPWLKDSLDLFMIDCAFAVTPYMLYAGLQAKLR